MLTLPGSTEQEIRLLNNCGLPRLRAVITGQDRGLEESGEGTSVRRGSYISYDGGGSLIRLSVTQPIARRGQEDEYPSLEPTAFTQDDADLRQLIVTAEGFLPCSNVSRVAGVSFDGRSAAVVFSVSSFLTQAEVNEVCSSLADEFDRLQIYYFRSSEDFSPEQVSQNVVFRRIPMDLSI